MLKKLTCAFLLIFLIRVKSSSILIETPEDSGDYKCEFTNRSISETIRFVRSPYSCRVYHICAYYKQYSLTCPEGLFFDEELDACNFESLVECQIANEPISTTIETSSNTAHTNLFESVEITNEPASSPSETNTTQYQPFSLPSLASLSSSVDNLKENNQTQTTIKAEVTTPLANTTPATTFSPFTLLLFTYKINLPPNQTLPIEINTENIYGHLNLNQSRPQFASISLPPLSTTETTTLWTNRFEDIEVKENNLTEKFWDSPKECIYGFEHKIVNKENCALYYHCSIEGTQTEKACPYPLLYDELFNECRAYDQVDCGARTEPKDLCDYKTSLSKVNATNCSLYPSCKNLSDGLYPSSDCKNYFQCKDERTLRLSSCPQNATTGLNLRFNILTRRCDTIDNVSFNCGGYTIPIDLYTKKMVCPTFAARAGTSNLLSLELKDLYFSHPKDCNLYIVCDNQGNITTLECTNGLHFSPFYQSCVHPSIANCKKSLIMDDSPLGKTPSTKLKYLDMDLNQEQTINRNQRPSISRKKAKNMLNIKHKVKTHNKLNDTVLNLYDSLSLHMFYKNKNSLITQMKAKQNSFNKASYENDMAFNATNKNKDSIIINTPASPIDAAKNTNNATVLNDFKLLNSLSENTTNATDSNSGRANETVTLV